MKKLALITGFISLYLLQAQKVLAVDLNSGGFSLVQNDPGNIIIFIIRLLVFAGIVVALIFLILGGIQWILSGGDKQKVEAARNHIVAAIIGLVIIVLAVVILNAIGQFLVGQDLSNPKLPSLKNPTGN